MNITFIALLLTLILVPAYCDFYGDDYGDAYRHLSRYWRKRYSRKSVNAIACANAVAAFNGGLNRMFTDIQAQANEWMVYADLDALDEVSYYISHSCHGQPLELVDQQFGDDENENQGNQERTEGCDDLFLIVGSILAQDETLAFRGGYERGVKLSRTVLKAGRDLGENCVIRLQMISEEQAERDAAAANEEDSDVANEEGGVDENEWDLQEDGGMFMDSRLTWGFAFDEDEDDGEAVQEEEEALEEEEEEEEEEDEEREEQREEREEQQEERQEEREEQQEERQEEREEREEEREDEEEEREEEREEREEEIEEEREERREEREEREEEREEREERREEAQKRRQAENNRVNNNKNNNRGNNTPTVHIGLNEGGNNEEADTGDWNDQDWNSAGWNNQWNNENGENGEELDFAKSVKREKFLPMVAKLYGNQWESGNYYDYSQYSNGNGVRTVRSLRAQK